MSVSFGTFWLLFGLLWAMKPIPPPDENADDPDQAQRDYHKARRRRAVAVVLRVVMVLAGTAILIGNLIAGLGTVQQWDSFALLLGLYGGLMLLVQRSERNRRLATLIILAFCAGLVERYAHYRHWVSESNWSIYAALVLNYLFWLTIGRRYPPHSSEEIKVWGMDTPPT